MVVSPKTKTVSLIDVKGLYRQNPWLLKRKPTRDNLYYVPAFVPTDAPNEFFILTQKEANQLVVDQLARLGRKEGYPVEGFNWGVALRFKDRWSVLPA